MQKCANCGHENRPGVMYCENCGVSLAGSEAPLETKSIDDSPEEEKTTLGVEESVLIDVRVQGAALFGEQDLLRLDIEGSSEPIIIKPAGETIFGRRDPATGAMPDVDLTPYAGYRMGVSRRHAAIRFGDEQMLNLWDLGSSNGTYLNGERLSAHRPYPLHDGDELRLGQMMIRMHFQSPAGAPQPPGEKADKDAWVEAEEGQAEGASSEKPAESSIDPQKTSADSVEKRAGGLPGKPPDESKPIELGAPKEKSAEPAASADQSEGVITLPPVTDVFQKPPVKVEKPEAKSEEKPEEKPEVKAEEKTEKKPEEKSEEKTEEKKEEKTEKQAEAQAEKKADDKPEVPITLPLDDLQRAQLDAPAAPVKTNGEKTDKPDQKPETDSEPKPDSDVTAPPAKPDSESQDKDKRD